MIQIKQISKMRMSKINISLLAPLLAIILLIASCSPHAEINESVPPAAFEGLKLSGAQIQLANIQVAPVVEGAIGKDLLLTGILKVNEQSAVSISTRSEGRIEKLFFKTVGDLVNPGDSLYTIYSEDLIAAEREYFNIQRNNWNTTGQYPASLLLEDNLLFLGMVPDQITQLKKDGKILFTITIISQVKGIVRSVNITEGEYAEAGKNIFDLATDNTMWVEANSYPEELNTISVGMNATVIIPSAENKQINTRIAYINPVFDPGTNIARVRSVISNPDKDLHPGMLAMLNIRTQKTKGLIIPSSAIINDKDGSKVWVLEDGGIFSDRTITTGHESADSVLVLSGLRESEYVVISGAYLLNSEKILKTASGI
jgi:membrane fusion protein, copper/silver efflux system